MDNRKVCELVRHSCPHPIPGLGERGMHRGSQVPRFQRELSIRSAERQ